MEKQRYETSQILKAFGNDLLELGSGKSHGGGFSVYFPSRVKQKLNISGDESWLILVDADTGLLILTKDNQIVDKLRPQVIEARKKLAQMRASVMATSMENGV